MISTSHDMIWYIHYITWYAMYITSYMFLFCDIWHTLELIDQQWMMVSIWMWMWLGRCPYPHQWGWRDVVVVCRAFAFYLTCCGCVCVCLCIRVCVRLFEWMKWFDVAIALHVLEVIYIDVDVDVDTSTWNDWKHVLEACTALWVDVHHNTWSYVNHISCCQSNVMLCLCHVHVLFMSSSCQFCSSHLISSHVTYQCSTMATTYTCAKIWYWTYELHHRCCSNIQIDENLNSCSQTLETKGFISRSPIR